MKKTILITLAMLCVFGGVVAFGAGRVSDHWQTPWQDKLNLSIVSPVEMVNSEIKEYSFERLENLARQPRYNELYTEYKHLKAEHKEGMLTFAEAAAKGGTLAEKLCTDLDLKDKTVALELITLPEEYMGSTVFCGYFHNEEETVYTVAYLVDAFTGNLIYLYYDAPHLSMSSDDDFAYSNEEWNDDIIREKGRSIVYALGYSNRECKIVITKRSIGNIIQSQLKTKDGTVFMILYCADEEKEYPVTQIINCTALIGETEINLW